MKSNFDLKKIRCLATSILILSAVAVFAGCKDNGTSAEDARVVLTSVYDPSQPVGFTSFSPQRASVGGRVVLNGSNFGSDVSNIKVFVDDMEVIVVGADGDRIYIMIPNDAPSGLITIQIGKGSNMKEVVSTESFTYVPESYVGTLSGFTDKDNNSAIKDGPIDEAQYKEPTWLAFDSEKNIYLAEERGAMRRIDKDLTYVETLFGNTAVSGTDRLRTITFTIDGDTMYTACDSGNWTDPGTIFSLKSDGFRNPKLAISSKQCNGGAVHPVDGGYFFNSYEQGQVFKWEGYSSTNPSGGTTQLRINELFKIKDTSWEFNIQFHPSGDYAYIVVINQHYILKSNYNYTTQTLEVPTLFAGSQGQSGYKDGVATGARFRKPYQGAFDEDGNFYVCDNENHCIRKITPEGIVSTFAGRAENSGYTDGALRDAQFRNPHAILYDKDKRMFYVGDRENKRIRTIQMAN